VFILSNIKKTTVVLTASFISHIDGVKMYLQYRDMATQNNTGGGEIQKMRSIIIKGIDSKFLIISDYSSF